ncbi:hypothetical protein MKW98_030761 [Papaver atlanticum]|uniref:Uncharacterized protein n=1 Tax=Papaver atlanticum TaxID=357466 RepID=A0AAD4X734_9MAGN|nr:hypothetical protein MKW98_030761 [Papaver atlanticum]
MLVMLAWEPLSLRYALLLFRMNYTAYQKLHGWKKEPSHHRFCPRLPRCRISRLVVYTAYFLCGKMQQMTL